MTLILGLGNREQFIQVSDRRLSWKGKLKDDETNKAGILLCKDARQIFGFTGLANYGNFDTRKWLLNALYECCPPDYEINQIIPRLKERATRDFSTLPELKNVDPQHKRVSIMFSGYNYYAAPPLGVIGILTNFQDFQTGLDSPTAWNHFQMNYWTEIRPLDHDFTIVQRIGTWQAMTSEDESELRQMLREFKPFLAIADKAVSIIRKMSDRPKAGGRIGKHLSVVVLQRDVTQHVLARYYSARVGYKQYVPDEVVGLTDTRRRAVADRVLWIDGEKGIEKLIIPKAPKNSPCPCESGKKYRQCHGRSIRKAQPPASKQVDGKRFLRATGLVRRERPDFNDEDLLKWVRENWGVFAQMAYAEYLTAGRGAIFINLSEAVIDDDGIYFCPQYIADKSPELRLRGGWPDDDHNRTTNLIETYDPEKMVVLIFVRKNDRVSTMYMGLDDERFTPKHLYEAVMAKTA